MTETVEASNPLSPMDIARVARMLWQQAGAQPGHYAEYWSKVEQALTEARQAQSVRALADMPVGVSGILQSPEANEPARTIDTTVWGQTAWDQQVLPHEAEGRQASEPTRWPTPLRDR